jgi:hypothetical protein
VQAAGGGLLMVAAVGGMHWYHDAGETNSLISRTDLQLQEFWFWGKNVSA